MKDGKFWTRWRSRDLFRLVKSVGQRKNSESHMRNRTSHLQIPRSDTLPLSHRDSMVSEARSPPLNQVMGYWRGPIRSSCVTVPIFVIWKKNKTKQKTALLLLQGANYVNTPSPRLFVHKGSVSRNRRGEESKGFSFPGGRGYTILKRTKGISRHQQNIKQ